MINLREIRISLLYFFYMSMMISVILFTKKYHLMSANVKNIGMGGKLLITIVTISILAIIPCIIASIFHIVKAIGYNKVYYKDKHYAEWHYSRSEWTSFIINNFRKNNMIEMKSFKKAAVYYSIIILMAFSLDFLINIKDRVNMPVYLLIALAVFLIFFMSAIFRNIISMIDHILFTNRSIILMKNTIIVNGEILNLNIPLKKELMKKQIRNGNIEIEYAVPARYSDRYSNKLHLDVRDVKRLIIPIPDGKYEEAQKYIKAPFPIQHR